jgi:DNA repair protein RecO (recombination protein O)
MTARSKAIAKGVRRPKSRIGGSVEPFAELQLVMARGRTFDVITSAAVGEAWLQPARPPRIDCHRLVPGRAG